MAPLRLLALTWVLWSQTYVVAAAQRTPAPWPLNFNNTKGVGPDGPWRVLTLNVGFPDQLCDAYPGGQGPTLLIDERVCQQMEQNCPLPLPLLYDRNASPYQPDNWTSLDEITAQEWDAARANILNLTGSARYLAERVTLLGNDRDPFFGDNTTILLSKDFALNYPGRPKVAMSVGLLSLGLPSDTMLVESQVPSETLTLYTLLGNAAANNVISSRSWGLHIGSVMHKINGSLIFGGYDQSRVIDDVAVFDSEKAQMKEISFGTSSGSSHFTNAESNLLSKARDVIFDASVPYLHLPADICASIANSLPVTFNGALGLYLWNTDNETYGDLINSPSHMSFVFQDASKKDIKIRVPFALLNLTLESPLVSEPTAYFPCSPMSSDNNETPRLGRAFLQAAFIGQNWDSRKYFLAQAPGPQYRPPDVKEISTVDTRLRALPNAPTWDSTWASVLKPLPPGPLSTSSSPSNAVGATAVPTTPSSSLPPGGKAGIAIGALSGVAIAGLAALFLIRRHRKRKRAAEVASDSQGVFTPELKQDYVEAGELVGDSSPVQQPVHELPGHRIPE